MKFIDGNMLKQMIISGANNLFNHYPEVDALNVFPVPDGDTGINMNLTMTSGAKEIMNRGDDVFGIARAFSKGLLMGARGNSGVILSQIFRGFALALEGVDKITPEVLADAFVNGKDVAYKAVMRPVEGTILTVIRESSEALKQQISGITTIEKAFEVLLKEANESLQRTPELLPVLKEVGVVDSGGTGLVKVLEGFESAVLGDVIVKNMASVTEENQPQQHAADVEGDGFGYCTEFIMRLPEDPRAAGKKVFVEKRFSSVLGSHGNCLVVVRDDDLVKVHVHVLQPGAVFTYAQQFGEFVKMKCENMSEQHTHLIEENRDPLKQEKPVEMKEYAIIATSVGDGIEKMFNELNVTDIVSGGQTMNPSTEDFLEAIKKAHAKKIFILPNNSNIIMAATQACEVTEEGVECRVIPTKTIPQGLVASMMFNPESSFDVNESEMNEAMANVKSGQVTFAIRDTEIDGVEVKKDQFIALFGKKIVSCDPDKITVTMNMIKEMVDEDSSIITLIAGEDATDEEVEKIQGLIEETYPDVDLDIRKGNQPVYSFIVGVE